MSEPNPHQVKKLIVELKLEKLLNDSEDNHPQVPVKSIHDLELLCGKIHISKIIEVLVKYLFTEKPVDCDAVQEVFMAMFRQDKTASLNGVLKELPTLFYPEKVPPPQSTWLKREMEFKINLLKRRIADLIDKSLQNESKEELQQLAEFVEAQEYCNVDVSDTNTVDRFLSCLQMAVPLFTRGATSSKLLNCLNVLISSPDYEELSEQRKLDIVRALAEISSHTTTKVASEMLPSIVELSKKYIPQPEIKEIKSFTYVECVLYVLHQLALKAPDVATQLCNEEFMSRFKHVRSITRARKDVLAKTLPEEDKKVLEAAKPDMDESTMALKFKLETMRQSIKTEIRSCINILAITKLLEIKESWLVTLSWKEARKASLPSETYRGHTYSRAPGRSAALESIAKDHKLVLFDTGLCYPNARQIQRLNVLTDSHFQQVSSNRRGAWVLSDNSDIAMLCWQMKKSVLSFLRHAGEKGKPGDVIRNQLYHLLCWIYAATDLVSSERCLRKWEEHLLPLCPWYLCAFCDPSELGKDPRAKEPQDDNRIHHCYGGEIEAALLHIQKNGVPRESVSEFICTDYQPPSADEPGMERRKIRRVRRVNSLSEVLQELDNNHRVGADLIHYSQLMKSGKYVYQGPMTRTSIFLGYHAVVIEEVKEMDHDWVAVCKLSNGYDVGDEGYCYVSLTTQYIPIGVSDEKSNIVRGSTQPLHLLTNFVVTELIDADEDEKENWESDDKEEEAEDDDNSPEEKPKGKRKEPEEYIPKAKKFRSDSAHSGNSPSDLLVNNLGMLGIEDPVTVTKSDAVDEDAITKVMASVALLKLSSRSPSISERIEDIIVKQKGSLHLEKQQRALEYNSIVDMHKSIRSSLAERMSELDESTFNVRRAGSLPASVSTMSKPSVSIPNGVAAAPLVDVDSDDILLAAPSSSGADFLQDLLGVALGSLSAQSEEIGPQRVISF